MSAYPIHSHSYLDLLAQINPTFDVPHWGVNRAAALEQKCVATAVERSEYSSVTESGLAAWSLDSFESEILGRRVAKVAAVVGTGFQAELADGLRGNFQQASVRVGADQSLEIESLREIGFLPVDSLITFGGAMGEHVVSEEVRLAKVDDANVIAEISSEAFTNGRYMNDPWMTKEEGRQLYGEWGKNAASGSFGDATFVAGYAPSAFLVAQVRNDFPEKCGVIVLIAAAKDSRGQGLGAKLVDSARSWMADQQCTYLLVGTQSSNETAQKFYSSLGLKEIGRSITLAWGQD